MYDDRLLNISSIGCPCRGVADYDTIQWLVASPYQLIVLQQTDTMTGTVVSHEVRYMRRTVISDLHCQEGTEQAYYATYVPSSFY